MNQQSKKINKFKSTKPQNGNDYVYWSKLLKGN